MSAKREDDSTAIVSEIGVYRKGAGERPRVRARHLLTAVLVGAALLAATRPVPSEAKGYRLTVSPDTGEPGAMIVLAGDFWPPNVDVRIMVGFTASSDAEPTDFVGPISSTRSDAEGRWSVPVVVQSWGRMTIPRAPGFVSYKAVSVRSLGLSGSPEEGTATTRFVQTLSGHRPDGAGGVQLALSVTESASRTAWLDWEPAGSALFNLDRYGSLSVPFDTRIGWLRNGDWDLVVATVPGGLHPVSAEGATIDQEQATLCFPSAAPCAPRPGPVTAPRVHIQDGQIVPVHVVFAPSPGAPPLVSSAGAAPHLPHTGVGAAPRGGGTRLPVALAAVGVLVMIAGGAVALCISARRRI